MKYCRSCNQEIDEFNDDVKWAMMITKRGQKIIELESFHFDCWKGHVEESIGMAVEN